MIRFDKYHDVVHSVTEFFGYQYDDTAPDWIHPFIHVIFVFAPAMLIGVIVYLLIRAALRFLRRERIIDRQPQSQAVRGLEHSLFKTVLRYSRKQQAIMIGMSLISMPVLYVTLELPKQIVNNALDADRFPIEFLGYYFDQVTLLMILSGLYLLAISVNGLSKYVLNVFKGYVAERFLRRFRLLVYRAWRTDPQSQSQSEIVPILAQEVEPVGGFAADVLTLPVMQGGTLLTIMLFMFIQDPVLGAAALAVLPIQLILLPKLQRRVNGLSRIRIKEVRHLGRQLSNQLHGLELATGSTFGGASTSFRELEKVRRRIYILKFFIKALNNFLTALTPFLFYSLGGYFVIEGRISLGALVAVLAAHKDFSAPLKELFRYYQTLEDTRIRYHEITSFFSPDTLPEQQSETRDITLVPLQI